MSEDWAWDADLVRAVRAMGVREVAAVDEVHLQRARDEILDLRARHAVSALVRAVEEQQVVKIERRDVRTVVTFDELDVATSRRSVNVQAAWCPNVQTIEMRGGRLDGERMELRDVGRPVVVPLAEASPSWLPGSEAPSVAAPRTATYELAGWRPGERVWVYATKGRAA